MRVRETTAASHGLAVEFTPVFKFLTADSGFRLCSLFVCHTTQPVATLQYADRAQAQQQQTAQASVAAHCHKVQCLQVSVPDVNVLSVLQQLLPLSVSQMCVSGVQPMCGKAADYSAVGGCNQSIAPDTLTHSTQLLWRW